ncbi:phage baseplate plug family protein [Peribacillus muralis]|uniref:phage baseplate plug family protein n=1 Tax=Peribacillus muralis TaxID=264697 RepID=UPI003D0301CA
MDYIPIDKENLPEMFDIDLADETFKLKFAYNETGDFFTVDLFRPTGEEEDEEMIIGEKMVLNKPLWSDITDLSLPAPQLVPMDLSGIETCLTWGNFEKTVFLYINDQADDEDDPL